VSDGKIQLAYSNTGARTNAIKQNKHITLEKLYSVLSRAPTKGLKNKHDGHYILRGPCEPLVRKKANLAHGFLLIIDADSTLTDTGVIIDGAPDMPDACDALDDLFIPYVAYTSYSHQNPEKAFAAGCEPVEYHKYRLVIPCELSDEWHLKCAYEDVLSRLHEAGVMVASTKESFSWAQPWFLPSAPADRLECFETRQGACAFHVAERSDPPEKLPARRRTSDRQDGIIQLFNENFTAEEMLTEAGYEERSEDRWIHPDSESGQAGTTVLDTGKVWSFSGNDVLNDGHPHDPFDLLRILMTTGDFSSAMVDAKARLEVIGVREDVFEKWDDWLPLDERIARDVFPDIEVTTEKGKTKVYVLPTGENHTYLWEAYGFVTEHDEILKRVRYYIQNRSVGAAEFVHQLKCSYKLNVASGLGFSESVIDAINNCNPVNLPLDWIEGKPWDGVDRIQDVVDSVVVVGASSTYKDEVMRVWLRASALILENTGAEKDMSQETVFIMVGKQGTGKSRWLRSLVPMDLKQYVRSGLVMEFHGSAAKDSIKKATSCWLGELGELDATFRKSDIAHLKGFLADPVDVYRRPYGREEFMYPRRSSYFATVNEKEFLYDLTGNRRFMAIEVTDLLPLGGGFDRQQLWAQALAEARGGKKRWFDKADIDRISPLIKEQFYSASDEEVALIDQYGIDQYPDDYQRTCDPDVNAVAERSGWRWIKVSDITELLPGRMRTRQVGRVLTQYGVISRRRSDGVYRLLHENYAQVFPEDESVVEMKEEKE